MEKAKKKKEIDAIILELERMRQTSVRQYYRTDIYDGETIDNTLLWYKQIFDFVQKKPPIDHVKTVIVFLEDERVNRIEYRYGTAGKKIEFQFVIDLNSKKRET